MGKENLGRNQDDPQYRSKYNKVPGHTGLYTDGMIQQFLDKGATVVELHQPGEVYMRSGERQQYENKVPEGKKYVRVIKPNRTK